MHPSQPTWSPITGLLVTTCIYTDKYPCSSTYYSFFSRLFSFSLSPPPSLFLSQLSKPRLWAAEQSLVFGIRPRKRPEPLAHLDDPPLASLTPSPSSKRIQGHGAFYLFCLLIAYRLLTHGQPPRVPATGVILSIHPMWGGDSGPDAKNIKPLTGHFRLFRILFVHSHKGLQSHCVV